MKEARSVHQNEQEWDGDTYGLLKLLELVFLGLLVLVDLLTGLGAGVLETLYAICTRRSTSVSMSYLEPIQVQAASSWC
jgi:hypothetical protein